MTEFKLLKDHKDRIEQCAKWAFDAWGHYNPNATLQKRIDSFNQHCNDNSLPLTYLAFQNSQIIGMASLRVNDGIRDDLTPWLGSLYVADEYRGNNIGAQLIECIKNHARELSFKDLYLLTYEATLPKWYSSLGWKDIGTDKLFGNDVWVMKTEL